MPYHLGENSSPTHSPPIGLSSASTGSNICTGVSTNVPQNQSGYSAGLIRPQPQLPQNAMQQNAMAAMIASCVANGQSNGTNQTLLQHQLLNHQNNMQNSPSRIRVNSPTRLNSSSNINPHNEIITTTSSASSPTLHAHTHISQSYALNINETHLLRMSQISQLHRPFEIEPSSIKSKENS